MLVVFFHHLHTYEIERISSNNNLIKFSIGRKGRSHEKKCLLICLNWGEAPFSPIVPTTTRFLHKAHNSCMFLFLDGFSLSQSIIISTVNDSIVTKFQHTGNFRSGERLFGQHRKESFLFNKQVSPKNTLLWNKISRLHQSKWFSKILVQLFNIKRWVSS